MLSVVITLRLMAPLQISVKLTKIEEEALSLRDQKSFSQCKKRTLLGSRPNSVRLRLWITLPEI
jgi:hypothetical protein